MPRLLSTILCFLSATAWAIESGERVPALSLTTLDGAKPVALASLQGKVVYLDFWASWCVPCRLSMPTLDGLYRKHRDAGFEVVGVNKDVSNADAQRFLKRVSVTFTLADDSKDAAAKAFNVKAMPSGYLIDRKGVVRQVHRGFTEDTAAELTRQIESLIKEPSS